MKIKNNLYLRTSGPTFLQKKLKRTHNHTKRTEIMPEKMKVSRQLERKVSTPAQDNIANQQAHITSEIKPIEINL